LKSADLVRCWTIHGLDGTMVLSWSLARGCGPVAVDVKIIGEFNSRTIFTEKMPSQQVSC